MSSEPEDEKDLMKEFDFEKLRAIWNSKRKTEFNFDEWCKEIDSHPMFMTSFPTEDRPSELLEALQAVKYDTDGSLEEQALAYKEDGNHWFKKYKYREAINAYTEGIKIGCSDSKLNAELYNNRSAANFFLENYRMAIKDCLSARKYDPNHVKAFKRGLDCLINLHCPDEAVRWINEAPDFVTSTLPTLEPYQRRIMKMIQTREKEKRKQQLKKTKLAKERQQLIEALKSRNLKFRDCSNINDITLDYLTITISNCRTERVSLSKEGTLAWPLLLLYPEYGTTDFIYEFDECSTLNDHLMDIFDEYPEWDVNKEYSMENVEFFFEDYDKPDTLIKISAVLPLKTILSHSAYSIVKSLPSLIVLSKASKFYANYLNKFNVTEF